MQVKTEWLVKGMVESVFVVGSILVALAVDAWAENQGFAELADLSLGIFEQEIVQNQARLEDAVPYHQGIRDLLGQMRQAPEDGIDVRGIMEGLEPPVLLSTAWETALATGALTHMDFDVVRALSLTYSIQEGFDTRSRSDRPRFGSSAGLSSLQIQVQAEQAYDYMAALTRDETRLMTVFAQALELIRAHRGFGRAEPADATREATDR